MSKVEGYQELSQNASWFSGGRQTGKLMAFTME
jgi:hypothetical protein